MELFRNTRLKIGKRILSKKLARSKRSVFYSNIGMVKSIGIVWDASNPEEFPCLTRFYQKMHDRNIEVKILGYFPGKNLPDKYTAIRYLTCIRKNEVSYFYNPISSESIAFINRPFEILIDVNFKKVFPLICISSLSKARFRVGLFEADDPDSPFDLMMEIKNPVDVESYLFQIMLYLEMINTQDNKKVD